MTPRQQNLWDQWGNRIQEKSSARPNGDVFVLSELLESEWQNAILENDRNELGKAFMTLSAETLRSDFQLLRLPITRTNVQQYKKMSS